MADKDPNKKSILHGFSEGDEQNFARLRQFMDTDKFFHDNNKHKIGGLHNG